MRAHGQPNGNGTQASLVHILLSIVDLVSAHHGHMRETLGRIEANQQTALTILAARETPSPGARIHRILSALGSILGHWGTLSAIGVASWKWLWPHVRPLLGW